MRLNQIQAINDDHKPMKMTMTGKKMTGMMMVDENYRDIHPCFIPDDAKVNVDCHRKLLGIDLQKNIRKDQH